MQRGKFIISLDFEIYWGVRDLITIDAYRAELKGVRQVIPRTLDLFEKYGVQATFATVGLLFFEKKEQMLAALPRELPSYEDDRLSPYPTLEDAVGTNEFTDPYHFGASLIKMIIDRNQEVGSHTFCHYYCLEPGQTDEQFREDIRSAIEAARPYAVELKSFVFPRNQMNAKYIAVLKEFGIRSYRGNPDHFMYDPSLTGVKLQIARALRLMDAYLSISGDNTHDINELRGTTPVDIPASRFLRPFIPRLKALDRLRMRRIKRSMTAAARQGRMYHLWWHPHNFGRHQQENFILLEEILAHFKGLQQRYGFESVSMEQFAEELQALK